MDFGLAPDLHHTGNCKDGRVSLASAAAELVDWLYPTGPLPLYPLSPLRAPMVTTTTHMIHHIFQVAGSKSGLVCTDGIFLGDRRILEGDASAFIGHARVLSINMSISQCSRHHRGMAVRGFAFQNCDVAVCLNVTPDHLFKGEIETMDEMVEIKRSLLERTGCGSAERR